MNICMLQVRLLYVLSLVTVARYVYRTLHKTSWIINNNNLQLIPTVHVMI